MWERESRMWARASQPVRPGKEPQLRFQRTQGPDVFGAGGSIRPGRPLRAGHGAPPPSSEAPRTRDAAQARPSRSKLKKLVWCTRTAGRTNRSERTTVKAGNGPREKRRHRVSHHRPGRSVQKAESRAQSQQQLQARGHRGVSASSLGLCRRGR